MVGDDAIFDLRVHAPINTADALHQTHGVPVDVVVDEAGAILEVEPLGEHIGGDQDADLGRAKEVLQLGG